jgi:acetylornithine/succinyldiaminopimelate/putrescine aminotransferase
MISDTARSNALDVNCLHTLVIPFPRHGFAAQGFAAQGAAGTRVAATGVPFVCPGEDCGVCDEALAVAKKLLSVHADRLSMLMVEPAIGARGYWFASVPYYRRLIEFAKQLGLVVVSDEIQMGLGRLGPLLVGINDGWGPDLVVLGKSLGGGIVPISAVLGPGDWMDRLPASIESETFAATPLACRIAEEVLRVMEEEVISTGRVPSTGGVPSTGRVPKVVRPDTTKPQAMTQKGDAFRELLRDNMPECVRIEGRGMASVLSLDALGDHGIDVAKRFTVVLSGLGVLAHLTGPRRDRLALIPPLNIPEDMLLDSVALFAAASKAALR